MNRLETLEVLKKENQELRTQNNLLRADHEKILSELSKLLNENKHALKIIWAAAKSAGGKLHISKVYMQECQQNALLESYEDPSNGWLVFKATIENNDDKASQLNTKN